MAIQPPRAGTSRTRSARRLFHAFPQQGELPLKIVFHAKGVELLLRPGPVNDQQAQAKQFAESNLLAFQAAPLPAALLVTGAPHGRLRAPPLWPPSPYSIHTRTAPPRVVTPSFA